MNNEPTNEPIAGATARAALSDLREKDGVHEHEAKHLAGRMNIPWSKILQVGLMVVAAFRAIVAGKPVVETFKIGGQDAYLIVGTGTPPVLP